MRLKNFIISLESATSGVPRGATDGKLDVPNSSTINEVVTGPSIGIFTLMTGSSDAALDYSHFNVYSLNLPQDASPILSFDGSLSARTENSEGVEGSVLVVSGIED